MAEALDLGSTLGALLIGATFALFLFGIVTLQVHLYYSTFKEDKWFMKAFVALVWTLELAQTCCIAAEVYTTTITKFGRPELLFPFRYLGGSTAIGGCIALCVHCFFSARVWRVLPIPWRYIGVGCALLALVRCAGSIALGYNAARAPSIEYYRETWGWLIMSLLVAGAALDVIIACSMMGYLVTQRNKVFKRTVSLIDRLIQYTICTGLLTSITAMTVFITYLTGADNLIWIAIYTILSKLYSNSVLAALNGRASLRESTSGALLSSSSAPDLSGGTRAANPTLSQHRSRIGRRDPGDPYPAISVEMKTTVHADYDESPGSPRALNPYAGKKVKYSPSPYDVSFPPVMNDDGRDQHSDLGSDKDPASPYSRAERQA